MVDEVDAKTAETDSKGTVSFSVRLTEKEKDLLTRAAETKGWSITNLLKNAAREKAAFILNTSAPNQVDFRRIAAEVAAQVFAPRVARVAAPDGRSMTDADAVPSVTPEDLMESVHTIVEISPWQMPPTFVDDIRSAARFGGTEFLSLLLEAAEAIAIRHQPDRLSPPIDPSAL